eukprot:4508770-Prymnesium_polylepis.1
MSIKPCETYDTGRSETWGASAGRVTTPTRGNSSSPAADACAPREADAARTRLELSIGSEPLPVAC